MLNLLTRERVVFPQCRPTPPRGAATLVGSMARLATIAYKGTLAGLVLGQRCLVRVWETLKLWDERAAARDALRCSSREVWQDLGPGRVAHEADKPVWRE